MVRCRNCSRSFDGVGTLEAHDCDGQNVTVLVIHPDEAEEHGENPARVFRSRAEAEAAREHIDAPVRMIDAPLIESGQDE